jgi:hypothetical protein
LAKSLAGRASLIPDPVVDRSGIQAAFDNVFDQAIIFHGFTDYMRDYDVFVYATADPRTGIAPEHLRYRFKHPFEPRQRLPSRRKSGAGHLTNGSWTTVKAETSTATCGASSGRTSIRA